MKIALLNLPYDNNYGGNLQRYALMKVLQDMGHDVTHVNLRFHWQLPWYKKNYVYIKRLLKKILINHHTHINQEKELNETYKQLCSITDSFYERYIEHTEVITDIKQLKNLVGYEAYIVGSDQVWRKKIAKKYLQTLFLDFLPHDTNTKKIAYAVSMGNSENELNSKEILYLGKLYKRFDAVSVREQSALSLFESYGWTIPKASVSLDPTLLLSKENYTALIDNAKTVPSEGQIFCYILDDSKEKQKLIEDKEKELEMISFRISLKGNNAVSIEQWLRSFNDAEYVITDSYHGLLFSIIFRKPFYLFMNPFRGNARFDSVLEKFGISANNSETDWNQLSNLVDDNRKQSLIFLSKVL